MAVEFSAVFQQYTMCLIKHGPNERRKREIIYKCLNSQSLPPQGLSITSPAQNSTCKPHTLNLNTSNFKLSLHLKITTHACQINRFIIKSFEHVFLPSFHTEERQNSGKWNSKLGITLISFTFFFFFFVKRNRFKN